MTPKGFGNHERCTCYSLECYFTIWSSDSLPGHVVAEYLCIGDLQMHAHQVAAEAKEHALAQDEHPATLRCKWDVVVKFSSSTQTTINGKFNATRD